MTATNTRRPAAPPTRPTGRAAAAPDPRPDGVLGAGPVWWPILAGVASLLVAAVVRWINQVPDWAPLLLAGTFAAVQYTAVARRDRPALRWYTTVHWFLPALWGTLTGLGWWPHPAAPWIVLLAVTGASLQVSQMLLPEPDQPAEAAAVTPTPPVTAKATDLGDHIIDLINSKFAGLTDGNRFSRVDVTKWPADAGLRLTVRFPARQRITLAKVQTVADELAADLKLPNGCTVRIAPGITKDLALIDVELVDRLVDSRRFPAGADRPRSIRDDFPLGFVTSGADATINLLQASAMFTAQRGGGKTVLLHNAIANLVLCRDALTMVIDINGGGIAAPWLRPFARGEVDRPAIDWVATTPRQALAMGRALIAMARDRKSAYASLLLEHDTDVLPVSPKVPAVVVVVDEGHTVFGMDATKRGKLVGAVLAELQKIARAMCVNLILTTQRATSDYVPSGVKSQTTIGAVGPVLGDSEIAFLLDWNHGLAVRDLTGPGQFFLRNGPADTPRRMKTYQLLPQQIADIARTAAKIRPDLDDRGRKVMGSVYADRWMTLRPWLDRIAGNGSLDDLIVDDSEDDDDDGVLATGTGGSATVAAASQLAGNVQAKVRAELAALLGPANSTPPAPALGGDGDDSRGRTFIEEQLAAAGPDGLRTGDLYDQAKERGLVGDRRQTVNDWLSQLAADTPARVAKHPVGYGRWVAVKHLPAAASGVGQAA